MSLGLQSRHGTRFRRFRNLNFIRPKDLERMLGSQTQVQHPRSQAVYVPTFLHAEVFLRRHARCSVCEHCLGIQPRSVTGGPLPLYLAFAGLCSGSCRRRAIAGPLSEASYDQRSARSFCHKLCQFFSFRGDTETKGRPPRYGVFRAGGYLAQSHSLSKPPRIDLRFVCRLVRVIRGQSCNRVVGRCPNPCAFGVF